MNNTDEQNEPTRIVKTKLSEIEWTNLKKNYMDQIQSAEEFKEELEKAYRGTY